MTVHTLGAWHTETGRAVRVSGQWRTVTGMAVRTGGAWRSVPGYTSNLSASAPDAVDGYNQSPDGRPVTVTTSATITPSGGVAPYSYQWAKQNGDSRIFADTLTMATINLRATLRQGVIQAAYGYVVTDAAGQTATGTVVVTLEVDGSYQ